MVDFKNFHCDRVEVYTKAYDAKNNVIKEQVEYWYPGQENINKTIGFKK